MTTSAAQRLATESYSNLLSVKAGPFHVIEVKTATLVVAEDDLQNTVFLDKALVAPEPDKTPTENTTTHTEEKDAEKKKHLQGTRRKKSRMSLMRQNNTR